MSARPQMHHQPRYREALPAPPRSVGNQLIYTALAVALRFQKHTPEVKDLVSEFGMCRATAYRWRGAMKAAKGEP